MLRPSLNGTALTFLSASLPHVSAAFEGMDHLAEDSGITTRTDALHFLHTLGVKERDDVDVLRGAQKLKIVLTLNKNTVNAAIDKATAALYWQVLFER